MGSRVETDSGLCLSLDSAANIFVNRLNSVGQGQGNVFLGPEDSDSGNDITVEQSGKVLWSEPATAAGALRFGPMAKRRDTMTALQ